MKKTLVILAALAVLPALSAQNHFQQVLRDVESGNPTLKAAQQRAEAQEASAHAGTLLEDPSVEAAYFWGSPAEIGKRWDLSVSQSFDMPSVYVRRSRIRDLEGQAASLGYGAVRNALLKEAQKVCSDLVYHRAVAEIYSRRCQTAIRLAESYQARLAMGDCTILEYNRAQMNMADVQNRAAAANLKADEAVRDLQLLTGDASYQCPVREYEESVVEANFDEWYKRLEMESPELKLMDNQAQMSEQEAKLRASQWLPSVDLGYASENVVGETFRGVKVGLTLPIWSQPKAVRAAKLEAQAARLELTSRRTERYSRLLCLYHRHEAMIRNVKNMKEAVAKCNSEALLEKALVSGEITLEDYLLQMDYYTEMEIAMWDTARELEEIHIELYSVAL